MSSRFVDGNKPQVYSCAATPTTSSSTGQAPAVDDKPVPVAMHGVLHMPGTASHGSSESVRVHFPEGQAVAHDADIQVAWVSESLIDVHLGFLQLHRRYEVRFTVHERSDRRLGCNLVCDPLQNLHVKVASIAAAADGESHEITLDLATYKEKLMTEELHIHDPSQNNKRTTVKIHARVLGKGKGTPMLKTGIRCTAVEAEEESEMSDWQGF